MEQQQRSLIFTAAVGLIILAIIVGSVYYLVKFIQTRVATSRQSPQASAEIVAQASVSPSPEGSVQGEQASRTDQSDQQAQNLTETQPAGETKGGVGSAVTGDRKTYKGQGFSFSYPKSWSLLTCTNSTNIELNPAGGNDSRVSCDTAQKPITVLVNNNWGCSGDSVNIGSVSVKKSKQSDGGYIKYQWCTKTTPMLNITHRVSNSNDPATSKTDYSKQIEEMITSISR
jgi:hypothetical protein